MPSRLGRASLPLLSAGDKILDRAAGAVGDASRTVKFLRGRAAFEPRERDVFVASYPRSGTTWTQLLVYLLVSGQDELAFSHLAEVSPWWERSLAYRSDAPGEFAALPDSRVFKTHLPRRWLPAVGRCVYVWRDPADVAVSYFHLYRRYLGFDGEFGAFFERFLRGDVQYKSWFRHVAGWSAHRGDPQVLFVSYEEMRRDPRGELARIADFLGIPLTSARVEGLVAATDFQSMKAHEQKFDHLGELRLQWGIRDGAFVRSGRLGDGAKLLSSEQLRRLEREKDRSIRFPALEWRLPAFLH